MVASTCIIVGGIRGETKMQENVLGLVKLGKIPNSKDMSIEFFNQYDKLLQSGETLSFEEAELLITLFSDDDDDLSFDLNWGLIHAIESVDYTDVERYRKLISKCNNPEYREILEKRLNNYLKKINGTDTSL